MKVAVAVAKVRPGCQHVKASPCVFQTAAFPSMHFFNTSPNAIFKFPASNGAFWLLKWNQTHTLY